jgi:hypothetical protein
MRTTRAFVPADHAPPELDAAILSYLNAHPNAVDSLRGIVAWWLQGIACDAVEVERALERLVAQKLVEQIRLADGTLVYGKRSTRMTE